MGWITALAMLWSHAPPSPTHKHSYRQACDRVKTPVDPYFTIPLLSHSEKTALTHPKPEENGVHAECAPV